MMMGFYIVIAQGNIIKKIVGPTSFKHRFSSFTSRWRRLKATAPILAEGFELYSNPLPHVLILTAIVVGVATTALIGLAIASRKLTAPSKKTKSGC